jgi:glycosyltransferase involved in cell wall biosynthesis
MLKISIITICYNNAKTIRRTIESVINQSYPAIEYILVDGGSKDGTLDIIGEYKDRISGFISEKDKNLYDAINKGLKMATGDVAGLIHAGDRLFNTEVIQKIADHFTRNDIDIMYGNSLLVNSLDVPVRVNISPEYSRGLVKRGWMPSHQSIYIRRPLLEKYGYYNISLHPSSDYEFFLRYFYFNNLKIKKLNAFVLRFSMGGISTRNYMNNLRGQKQHVECWKVNGENPPFYLVPMKLLRKPRQFVVAAWYRFTGKHKRL